MKKTDQFNKRNITDKRLCMTSIISFVLVVFLFINILWDEEIIIIDDNTFFILLIILNIIFLITSLSLIIRLILKNKKNALITTFIYSLISLHFNFWAYIWIFALAHNYIIWGILTTTSIITCSCGIVWILYCIIKIIFDLIKYLYNQTK